MLHSIDITSAARLFYIADLHRLPVLKQQARDYISRHPRQVMDTEGWSLYLKPRSDLLEELYADLAERVSSTSAVIRFH